MPAGFQLIHPTYGTSTIDSDRVAARLVQYGTLYINVTGAIPSAPYPAGLAGSAPLFLVRPDAADGWLCGFCMDFSNFSSPNAVFLTGNGGHTFEFAYVSNRGVPIVHGSGSGLELYNGSGQLTFSSNHRHPRIHQIVTCNLTDFFISGSRTIANFNLPFYGTRPWLLSSDFVYSSWANGGNDIPTAGHQYGCRLSAAGTTLTVEIFDEFGNPTNNWTGSGTLAQRIAAAGSPFATRPIRIAICTIPGY